MTHTIYTTTPSSLPVSERLATMDILRGFALMGVLIINMPHFSSSLFTGADGSHIWTSRIDQAAEWVVATLFTSKFNGIFSALIGIGFTIQYARLVESDPSHATSIYLRRLAVLGVIGVIHGWIFWPGDVLHTYAILGVVLVMGLRRMSDRGIMALIAACLLWPAVSGVLRLFLVTKEMTAQRVQLRMAFETTNDLAYGHGGLIDMVVENSRMMAFFYDNPLNLWGTFNGWVMISLTMLIGLLAGRRRWVQRADELMPQIRPLTWWALGIGLACGVAFTVLSELNRVPGPSPTKVLGWVCSSVSRLAMTAFYMLVFVRLVRRAGWQRRLSFFALAGRMPLTTYLMQTVICLTLYRSWGFGLWMKVGPALSMLLSLVIFFAIQVPLSRWWLRSHERGPIEALWARLTYGQGRLTGVVPTATGTR